MSEDIHYELYKNKCDQVARFVEKIDLLERKLAKAIEQRNEFNSRLNLIDKEYNYNYIWALDKELEDLK